MGFEITPLQARGLQHHVERAYRESSAHQWVRETLINALEAGATRVEFGVEWQAVNRLGVYRRTIADNGLGMTADELYEFFNNWGGGGKPIGGVHENFGIGAKSSLLPWNRYGLVVVSWRKGEANMIWLTQNEEGEYGLRTFDLQNDEGTTIQEVMPPFPDTVHGCDWARVKPSWIGHHGTVLILLGTHLGHDTILGDPNREGEMSSLTGIPSYLSRRIWRVPSHAQVHVYTPKVKDRAAWPNKQDWRQTLIHGARYEIVTKARQLTAEGTVSLSDGTDIDWFLWEGKTPGHRDSVVTPAAFIAALYRDELYDVRFSNDPTVYRNFGVAEAAVRRRLWLVARPPYFDDETGRGIYPTGDRTSLRMRGGPDAGERLPFAEWGAEFSASMPEEIHAALRQARVDRDGSLRDESYRRRLAERFGARFRIPKLRLNARGGHLMDPTQVGTTPRVSRTDTTRQPPEPNDITQRRSGTGTRGALNTGDAAIDNQTKRQRAKAARVGGGIPTWRACGSEDLSRGMIAAWSPIDPDHPEGIALLNVNHPVIQEVVEEWQAQYPDSVAERVRDLVYDTYGEVLVAKIAHSEGMKGVLSTRTIEDTCRSEASLTMAMLGLVAEQSYLEGRLRSALGRRLRTVRGSSSKAA